MKHNALGGTSEDKHSESRVFSFFFAKPCAKYINSSVTGIKFQPQNAWKIKND